MRTYWIRTSSLCPVHPTWVYQPIVVFLLVNAAATSSTIEAVELEDSIPYDFLAVATGTGPAGHLALVGQDKIAGVEIAHLHQENVKNAKHIVIVGGGEYGIQLATDLKTRAPTQSKRVIVVHSRPQPLNQFHEGLHEIALSNYFKFLVYIRSSGEL
ncbi:hypothetical protein BT96DRAFT_1018302 [Gymnopus androsaceus JB14]|uniref:FAD/NAD(P)-binding domain-containing protein n=1 Tax=Gymnopus androsaceus JB14 TaxID=1447944 RepID=A0A6A4HSU7_9AGAR|nr:hypothetical protein BT96DRAFT_1018302 [Gymnopus androsaceus JB14]